MHPIFFSIWKFTAYFYGLFVGLAFIASNLYLSYSLTKSKNKIISQDKLDSLFIFIPILGAIGARVLFVITNLQEYILYPLSIFKFWKGGFVYYGGFISVMVYIIIYSKRKKIHLFKLCDFFAPALALGHAIGRIGCFFAGCCYGKESNLPWAVTFNNEDSVALQGVRLHPTQLYESLGNLLLFICLHFYSKREHKAGTPIAIYFICYAVLRFIIEFFRGDDRGMQYFGLYISQVISIFLFITGVIILVVSLKTSKDLSKNIENKKIRTKN
ncbi:prolipoprotein diacylglyceryl transferase [Endomicrobiia bacterium]|nr:prolipoprotein diacylglyceryl transferase [Endomicrobiia bacterium]